MMSVADKKKQTLLKRRKRAIILSVIAIIALSIALVLVLDYAESVTFPDSDGTEYFIRKKKGAYGLYDQDRNLVETESQYGYFVTDIGTLIQIDAETGAVKDIIYVDDQTAVESEVFGIKTRLQIFPRVEKAKILSIEVHNDSGEFTFHRYNVDTGKVDKNADFIIKDAPLTIYNEELFATLYVNAGYSLTLLKLDEPRKDSNGEYSEYGLVAETRVDEDGNEYWYEPAYYILTTVDGVQHKMIVGDRVIPTQFTASDGKPVTTGGYYCQYVDMSGETEVKRDAVYVMDNDMSSIVVPIETYITPLLSYPMSSSDYYDVEDFTIGKLKEDAKPGDSNLYDPMISFSYIDMADREDTLLESFPYEFHMDMSGFTASSTMLDLALQQIYNPAYVGVCAFQPDNAMLAEYGLYTEITKEDGTTDYAAFSPYTISFKYDILGETEKDRTTIHQLILLSDQNENGNYYAYTVVSAVKEKNGEEFYDLMYSYDMIIEIAGSTFNFLTWDRYDWISQNYINTDIYFVDDIEIKTPDYEVEFDFDNSLSDMTADVRSQYLMIHASDSLGHSLSTFGKLNVTDVNGYIWEITVRELNVYDSAGNKLSMADGVGYFANNKLGTQARCRNGYIDCGSYQVYVTADTVRVVHNNGTEESYVRYSTALFRKYYQTLLYASISDSYEMSEEDEAALLADESKWLMTITMNIDDGKTQKQNVYSFYRISSRKAYITINGDGGFYVMTSRLDKFISDAQRFFNLEDIDPLAKS